MNFEVIGRPELGFAVENSPAISPNSAYYDTVLVPELIISADDSIRSINGI